MPPSAPARAGEISADAACEFSIATSTPDGNDFADMTQWFYGENGQQFGPVDDAQLNALIAEGRIGPGTLLWREGLSDWQPLDRIRASGALYAYASPQAQTPAYGAANRTSGLAIGSLVCGILGFIIGLAAIPAVICGHLALREIATFPVPLGGRGMAIAGLVCGYFCLLLTLGSLAFAVFSGVLR